MLTPTIISTIIPIPFKHFIMIQTQQEYLALIVKVNQLRNEIHLFNEDSISEEALDNLKMKITNWEAEHPDLVAPNSPNYTIAGGISAGFVKVQHSQRMLSLNDIFSEIELEQWQERWQKYADQNSIKYELAKEVNYICEPKIDGLAISLIYKEGKLKQAVTRGDGFIGEDVTNNVLQIHSIPKSISEQKNLEIRGEIFMTKSDFEDLNQKIINGILLGKMSKTGPEFVFANPRNVASGTIRQLDSSVVKDRKLSFIAYNVYILN
jgi:DNA ligase (NAD+)